MCILFLYFCDKPTPNGYRLIMASNRDEFYFRPTARADFWEENPNIIAGIFPSVQGRKNIRFFQFFFVLFGRCQRWWIQGGWGVEVGGLFLPFSLRLFQLQLIIKRNQSLYFKFQRLGQFYDHTKSLLSRKRMYDTVY